MSDTEAPPAEEAPAPEDAAPAVVEADAAAPAAPEGGGAAPAAPAGGNSEALTLSAQSDQVESKAPIADPDTGSIPNNLVLMPEMTKDILLDAVKVRFENDGIYTFVADILVALNPYQWIDMYGTNYKERYNPQHHVCEVPHVYAVAQRAAKNLRMLDRNQVCIISGESGSGKTETAKLFMHHLLAYSGGSDGSHVTALEQQILESQPLLEAFGNAKTGLNNNSSRFGKYIEVLFEGMDKVLGARVRKYLLEKSRVVGQVDGERNFHVFYYLCDGAPAALRAKLNLQTSDHYRYLQGGGEASGDPAVWFAELEKSVRVLGFAEEDILSMWTVVAAILKTGQIDFVDNEGSVDDSCSFADKAVAQDLADTLGITLFSLENALTTKHVVIVGEINHKPLNAALSRVTRDILAQNMYDNLFSWLTDQLNAKLDKSDPSEDADEPRSVAVLDIFGFENFPTNGFEQMFINTANEKLQHYFIEHIFTYEVRELKEEGIKAPKIEYTTNTDQVAVLLGDRGIFGLLDEQTKMPRSNDQSTITKMHQELSANPSYDNVRNSPVQFQISHYAGTVKYQIEGFLEKNRNNPSLGIASALKGSTNSMVCDLFKSSETTEERMVKDKQIKEAIRTNDQAFMRRDTQKARFGKKAAAAAPAAKPKKKLAPWQIKNLEGKGVKVEEKKKPRLRRVGSEKRRAGMTTLAAAFKGSLEDLMEMLNAATPHFVRCIKPNMTKKAKKFDGPMVQKQLNYTGVLETTKIRQLGYPLRLTFGEFCDRYRDTCIPATYRLTATMFESSALRILQSADLHGWGKGKTKMFLKYEHVNVLVNIMEGKKRAANEERAKAKAIQDKVDAEAAEIARLRAIEVAKIHAAAEASAPSKAVTSSLSWQEEMEVAKKKKKEAAERRKKQEEADAAAAAAAGPPIEEEPEDEEAARKQRFAKMKGQFGAPKAAASPRASPKAASNGGAGSKAGKAPPPPAAGAGGGDAPAAGGKPCGTYRLDMMGKQFGDCKCGFSKVECLAGAN